ncbi:MAG TPA: hypothetical protein VGJ20_31380 [Xanthobacteraceae bacterium]
MLSWGTIAQGRKADILKIGAADLYMQPNKRSSKQWPVPLPLTSCTGFAFGGIDQEIFEDRPAFSAVEGFAAGETGNLAIC